jgi:hypothetical protein
MDERFVGGDCAFVLSPAGRCRGYCVLKTPCPGYHPPVPDPSRQGSTTMGSESTYSQLSEQELDDRMRGAGLTPEGKDRAAKEAELEQFENPQDSTEV